MRRLTPLGNPVRQPLRSYRSFQAADTTLSCMAPVAPARGRKERSVMLRHAASWPAILFALIATLIGVYAMVGYRNLRALADDYGRVTRSHTIVHEIDAALASTYAAE